MFTNLYQRTAGGPLVSGGAWKSLDRATEAAKQNVSKTFKLVAVIEGKVDALHT